MAVTRVTKQEIETEKNIPSAEKPIKKHNQSQKVSSEKKYIDIVSDKQIEEFFKPYGYVAHTRLSDFIIVNCSEFNIIFNDFDTLTERVSPRQYFGQENSTFSYDEFEGQCELMNTNLTTAIADRIAVELFGKLPYYVEKRKEHFDNSIESVLSNKKYANLLKPTINRQIYRNGYAQTLKNYGSTDPAVIVSTPGFKQ